MNKAGIRLLFAATALAVVLALGMLPRDDEPVMTANPMKADKQQFERIQDYVNGPAK
jgi:hypothetical protein